MPPFLLICFFPSRFADREVDRHDETFVQRPVGAEYGCDVPLRLHCGRAGLGLRRAAFREFQRAGAFLGVPVCAGAAAIVTDPSANPLTGLAKADDWPEGMRPLAVMLDNVQAALPQRGLQSADLVYEMVTEGGITRLMAVYSDYTSMPEVGPVRSARDQHVQLMFPLGAMYLHVGGSTYAKALLSQYHYEAKSLDGYFQAGALELDAQRNLTAAIEHCWFTSGELFSQAAAQYRLDTEMDGPQQAVFQFVPYVQEPRVLAGGEASQLYIRFSSYANSAFRYDAEKAQYVKSQFGAPHLDENTGEAVTFDNLLVLFTDTEKYPGGILTKVNFAWGGVGWYFNGGRCEPVRWLKGAPEQPLRIVSADGAETPVEVNPGRTYIAVVGLDMYSYFRINDTAPVWQAAE